MVVHKKQRIYSPLYLVYSGGPNRMHYCAQKNMLRNLQPWLKVEQNLSSAAFHGLPSTPVNGERTA